MASTYVNDLRLNEMATGDGSGTWGDTTNTNLELIAEAFSYGTEVITTNADTHTTTIADGATDPGRSMYLKYTGTLDSACTITIGPNTVSKVWIIENGTSGSQDIILSQGSGANITIPAGDTKVVYSDGAGAGAAFFDAFASLSVVDLKVQDDLTVTDAALVTGVLTTTATQVATGGITSGSDIISDTDSTDSLGSTGVRWLKGWFDTLTAGTLTVGSGSVTDSSGAISFGDENLTTTGIVTAAGTSVFTNLDISGDIDVDGTTNLDVVDIDGAVDMATTLAVAGNVDFNGDLDVDGTTNLDVVDIDGAVDMATTLAVAGNVDFNGDLDVDGTTNLDVVDIDGAVDMATTLAVAGNVDFNGDLDVDGTTNLDVVDVDGAVNFAADVTFADGADIITASAGTSNFRAGVNAGNSY
jgi:cytoskeletal protein CcmA (bactofilin family)